MEGIADRLRKARMAAGHKSVRAAVDFLGASYPTYSAHENGSRNLTNETAVQYAKRYGVNLEWLLTGSGTMKGDVPPDGFSREVIISVARELSEEGVLPPNDDLDTVVKAFLELCDEHARRLSNPRPPLDFLKSHH